MKMEESTSTISAFCLELSESFENEIKENETHE